MRMSKISNSLKNRIVKVDGGLPLTTGCLRTAEQPGVYTRMPDYVAEMGPILCVLAPITVR